MTNEISYQTGFGNTFESESISGSLPKGRNNPRKVSFDLYCEQLSGTAMSFLAEKIHKRGSWTPMRFAGVP